MGMCLLFGRDVVHRILPVGDGPAFARHEVGNITTMYEAPAQIAVIFVEAKHRATNRGNTDEVG